MDLEDYYFEENEKNIFLITYLQVCYVLLSFKVI